MEKVVTAQRHREVVDLAKGRPRATHPPHRDRAVQPDDRRVGEAEESVVEGDDLRPVGLFPHPGFGVNRGDRRLHLVRTWHSQGGCAFDQSDSFGDAGPIPHGAVLVRQEHHLAGRVKARTRTR